MSMNGLINRRVEHNKAWAAYVTMSQAELSQALI